MEGTLAIAVNNLTSPIILFFVLGMAAALARSDLSIPEAIAKGLSIYLLFAIGFKGGVSVADHGVDLTLVLSLLAGLVLSLALPFIAFGLLKGMTRLSVTDAAALAGHYGSISIVTFVAATSVATSAGFQPEGYMVAVAAVMEAPAILSALWIVTRFGRQSAEMEEDVLREILLNGSIVLLVGAFIIGWITGDEGMAMVAPFIDAPFQGVLCLFLLDMGLLAGRGIRKSRGVLTPGLFGFGVLMPLVGASIGALTGTLLGLSPGGVMTFMALAASASYIAVPAAMRVALPEANPAVYLTMSLAVTFPFNLTLGIPLYLIIAQWLSGG
ncbi:sodium-dependent bicarbonate transport family permease [Spiribacter sp. 2438]|uniref:sodium-dependent bicarbonate transport family permease n=1 Tax=Spiribacter sp. 2438 TaxID=2666185 RepID=UPI0012AF88B4|nr:sodium-dependent bicarbonate transport family permease [Spiribacter sp. 2438]QGM21442.1 sodium-dependent bicarbonate transport family permease [Spiribacter sp. 2438]